MATDPLAAFLERFGLTAAAQVTDEMATHRHAGSDFSGPFSDILLGGDLFSANWDGAIPADLADGPDPSASEGFYADASAGAAQFNALYWSTGSVSPLVTAGTWADSGSHALPAAQAKITSFDLTAVDGIAASAYLLVDVRVTVEASGLAAGQQWWAQVEVQGATVGASFGQAAPAYTSADVSVGGTTSAESGHSHGNTGEDGYHAHTTASYTTHNHGISGATHDHIITCSAGHTDSTNEKSHDHTGSTTGEGGHSHGTDYAVTHHHSTGSSTGHNHTVTSTGTAHHGHSQAKSTITLNWVNPVNATAGAALTLGVQAGSTAGGATISKVSISYMIWSAPVPRPVTPAAAVFTLTAPQATPVIA